MNKLKKPATWRGKTSRVKADGGKSMRRIKRARTALLVDSMISFSGPYDGVVEIWCGETSSKLLLPLHWCPRVIDHLASLLVDESPPEIACLCPSL